jgi:tRNA (mo5U34)-methyltransferase
MGTELDDSPEAVLEQQRWYHTIELPDGLLTPGQFDTRSALARIPFPSSLAGKRCLDVGTSDGFWAFEMEKRGASEVVALDIDDPLDYDWPEPRPQPGTGVIANQQAGVNGNFALAHAALGSQVRRINMRAYDASPDSLGEFDFVFMGSLMLHLRDPVLALSRLRALVRGQFLSHESISLWTTLMHPRVAAATLHAQDYPRWWTPNLVSYRRLLRAAGFRISSSGGPYFMSFGPGQAPANWSLKDLSLNRIGFNLVLLPRGIPCAWALCEPT